jgi:ribosome recycling factor
MLTLNTVGEIVRECEHRMVKAVETTKVEFSHIRTGRASTALVENISVECYGSHMPLKQMATISTPDPKLVAIQPWDVSILHNIEKAIQAAGTGLNPQNDGRIIRIAIPALTEERRGELDKLIKKISEEHRISVRNIRREANEGLKKLEKEHKVTEDDMRKGVEDIQKITDKQIKHIDELLKHKEKEIFEV